MNWKNGSMFLAAAVLIAGALLLGNREFVQGQGGKGGPGGLPRHTVVATDGAHLIVTDNVADKLYFYAIDKDGKVGDVLRLRGTADLSEVGQPSIRPIDAKPQK